MYKESNLQEMIPNNVVNELHKNLTDKLMFFIKSMEYKNDVITIKFKSVILEEFPRMKDIIRELAKIPTWYSLSLEGCKLKDDQIHDLITQVIATKINILQLDISGNNITDKCERIISDLIIKTKIQYLCLAKNNYPDPVFGNSAIIRNAVLSNETLIRIEGGTFYGRKISADEVISQKLDSNSFKLEKLIREQKEVKRRKVGNVQMSENNSNKNSELKQAELKNMDLSSTIFKENTKFFKFVVRASKQNDFIEIKFNQDAKSFLSEIFFELSNNPVTYSISFETCELKDGDVAKLIMIIIQSNLNVAVLNLSGNDLTSSSVPHIVNLLIKTDIQELNVSGSLLTVDDGYGFDKSDCEKIKDAVKNSQTILKLSLQGHSVNEKDKEIITAHLETNRLRSDLKKAQAKVYTLDKEINQLKSENGNLVEKVKKADNTIKILEDTHKDLFKENSSLARQINHKREKKNPDVLIKAHVRGFLVRKHYKHELMKKHEMEVRNEMAKIVKEGDLLLVGKLLGLLNEKKIEEAMQVIKERQKLTSLNITKG